MSDFHIAVQVVLKQEGGYVNDPNDPGGETKFGICKRNHPNVDIANLTEEQAIEIYQQEYWQPIYEQINSQNIVNKLFSVGVDIGITNANVCLQRAVRAASGVILVEDGDIGSQSLSAINACNSNVLLAALKSELAAHYRLINNLHEIHGWLNRAYS